MGKDIGTEIRNFDFQSWLISQDSLMQITKLLGALVSLSLKWV